MPVPFPVVLGGLALAIFAFSGDDKKGSGGGGGPGGPGGGLPPGGWEDCFDDAMPPAFKTALAQVLATVTTPEDLEAAAEMTANAGFPQAAECLLAKADELKGGGGGVVLTPPEIPISWPGNIPPIPGTVPPIPGTPPGQGGPPGQQGDMPFAVRYGDYPYGLAIYYTGQGGRFKELEPLNPQLGPMVTKQGPQGAYSIYQNWAPGLEIVLPASWNAWSKPLPIPGTQKPSTDYPGGSAAA